MGRLIDADVIIETFKNTEDSDHCKWSTAGIVDEINFVPTVEAIPKYQINKAIEKIEQYICDVETDTIKAQGMAQALDMFEQALGGLDNGNNT